jgi:hypothetical protein
MKHSRVAKGVANLVASTLIATLLAPHQSMAEERQGDSTVNLRQLTGTWTAALSGVTGCGVSTLITTFTLDATGNGTQISAIEHTAACGAIDQSGQIAQIQSLNPDGSGFLALGCGVGCGFGFYFQLSRNLQMFNMGPESVPGNYLAGTAVRK